jgi:hypothetical protein
MYTAICLFADQFDHIKPVEDALKGKVNFIYKSDWTEEEIRREVPDIVIGINEFHLEIANCYQAAQSLNIPTLTIQDGILEWRFMFENELYNGNLDGVPMHHPVLADKYACIGYTMANIISSLGNEHKVEVIGMPKLDGLIPIHLSVRSIQKSPKNILIITAAKPWFSEEQKVVVLKMMLDLKIYFQNRKEYNVTWRITKLLDKELNIETSFANKKTSEITAQIYESDIVISTTSTAIIEAMRCGKPVIKIDYFRNPELLATTWNINKYDDIEPVLQQIGNLTPQLCWHQNFLLSSHCVNSTNASERLGELILGMISYKKANTSPLPKNMISCPEVQGYLFPTPSSLYPQREVLKSNDMELLRNRLTRLELRNSILKKELDRRSIGSILLSSYSKFLKIIRK